VVEVQVHGARGLQNDRSLRIEVLADTDAGIRLEQCTALNRGLREQLEALPEAAWVAEAELSVTSPGVGNPLKVARQFSANVGRSLEVKTTTGEQLSGTLSAFDAATDRLTLSWVARNPVTKKKESLTRTLPRADVARAVVQVSFAGPVGAKALPSPAASANTTSH